VITGAWVSLTVTVKVHWLLLPLLSRAVLVTVVVPTGKAKPLGGTLSTFVTTQLSVAVTLNVTLLVHSPGGVFHRDIGRTTNHWRLGILIVAAWSNPRCSRWNPLLPG